MVGGYLGDIAISDTVLGVNDDCSFTPKKAQALPVCMYLLLLFVKKSQIAIILYLYEPANKASRCFFIYSVARENNSPFKTNSPFSI